MNNLVPKPLSIKKYIEIRRKAKEAGAFKDPSKNTKPTKKKFNIEDQKRY